MRGLSGTWWCCITAHKCISALRVLRWVDYDLDLVIIAPQLAECIAVCPHCLRDRFTVQPDRLSVPRFLRITRQSLHDICTTVLYHFLIPTLIPTPLFQRRRSKVKFDLFARGRVSGCYMPRLRVKGLFYSPTAIYTRVVRPRNVQDLCIVSRL